MKNGLYILRCIFLAQILLLSTVFCFAQFDDWLWAQSFGGFSKDHGKGVATDSLGNVYTVGFFRSNVLNFGTYTLVNNGVENMFIVKHDRHGTVIWAKSAGGNSYDPAYCLTTDNSGNVYISGSSSQAWGTSLPGFEHNGRRDGFIAKLDNNGNRLWHIFMGTVGWDERTHDLVVDNDGNVYATGYTMGDWDPIPHCKIYH